MQGKNGSLQKIHVYSRGLVQSDITEWAGNYQIIKGSEYCDREKSNINTWDKTQNKIVSLFRNFMNRIKSSHQG